MPTIARRLFIPDAPAGAIGTVLGIQGDGTAGWINPTASGTTPYTTVDSLSLTPRSVTDWGPLINAAIQTGIKWFLFGPFDYPFSTTIVMLYGGSGSGDGPTFTGSAASWLWDDPGTGLGRTRLIWNGTGSTHAIDSTNILNCGAIENMQLLYSSGSFTGVLLDYFHSAVPVCNSVTFGSTSNSQTSAAAAVSLNEIVEASFYNCMFLQDFQTGVRGRESATGNYSNGAYFNDCIFNGAVKNMVCNPGLDWVWKNCTFEFTPGPGSGFAGIGQDFNYGGNFSTDPAQISLYDCSWWDGGGATQYAVQTLAGNGVDFSAINCKDHCTLNGLVRLYDLPHVGSVRIHGGNASNIINVGNAGVAAQVKSLIDIDGIDIVRGTDTATIINHTTGHHTVSVSAGWFPSLVGQSGQNTTLHHERAHRIDQPSIAAHSGVTNHAFTLIGSDMSGVIIIKNNGGATGPTGLLGDITLANPPASPGFGAGVAAHTEFPLVEIYPVQIDDANSNFFTGNMGTTYACQPYGYSKTLGNSGSQASWSLGVVSGIPASGVIAVGYRVIHL